MMTIEEWIASLPESMLYNEKSIDANGNVIDVPSVLIHELPSGGGIQIPQSTLATLLGSVAIIPPTHAELSALPIASVGGWQTYFDDWKSRGIIS